MNTIRDIQESLQGFVKHDTPQTPKVRPISEPNVGCSSHRRPYHYEKSLGSKGNDNLEDYLIPVIKLMWNGSNHNQAFREISMKLDVRYNTVSAQCTRSLGLTTNEFVNQVNSKLIVSLLERKYPDQYQKIKEELKI